MKPIRTIVILLLTLALSACATDKTLQPQRWAQAVQTADSRAAHLSLAEHYEEIAATLDADAAEERAMLEQYLAKPWKYGKRIHDLKSQASGMIQDLEKAAKESRQLATYHRQMAEQEK